MMGCMRIDMVGVTFIFQLTLDAPSHALLHHEQASPADWIVQLRGVKGGSAPIKQQATTD